MRKKMKDKRTKIKDSITMCDTSITIKDFARTDLQSVMVGRFSVRSMAESHS